MLHAPCTRLRRAAIVAIACICGWFVMELEMLGGRILTPYFGSAVYVVMGSVIGVFLLSLSGGYVLGGWLSRKPYSEISLGGGLAIAGAWLALTPWLIAPVCDGLLNLGLDDKWGSLIAALALFALPTVILGTVSPTVVRWLTAEASESGRNAGIVLGLSTVASFAGCIVTAFYLVLLSARLTLRVSGLILFLVGCAIIVVGLRHRRLRSWEGGAEAGKGRTP